MAARPSSSPIAPATTSRCCGVPRARPRLIEADVHLHRGRLEVRHLKTLGPLLWDRWYLASPRTPRLELAALLDHAGPEHGADARPQGPRPAASRRVARRARARPSAGPVAVCSRRGGCWSRSPAIPTCASCTRSAVAGSCARCVAGSRAAGWRDLDPPAPARPAHRRRSARAGGADRLLAGGDARGGPAAAAWGVDGVITERFEALAPALAEGRRERSALAAGRRRRAARGRRPAPGRRSRWSCTSPTTSCARPRGAACSSPPTRARRAVPARPHRATPRASRSTPSRPRAAVTRSRSGSCARRCPARRW